MLEYGFMQRALVAAALIGLAAPAVGIYLVQRRLSLMGDGIGHAVFTGVAAGLLTGTTPLIGAAIAACAAAVAIELLRERGGTAGDVALALVFYGGIAGGALLTYIAGAGNQIAGYLFGSLLTITAGDVVVIAVVSAGVLLLSFGLRKHLFAVCYDEEMARASGLPVRRLNIVIALVSAVTIVASMRVVGLLLVSALLVLPVAAAQRVASSFSGTMVASLLLGSAVSVGGLVLAYYADVVPGATIVLCGIGAFALTSLWSRFGPPATRRRLS